ncbi:DUF4377 domain-containing protein [Chitinophaga nivalis]|uniref:DUF4377 domain-containing protein n=1 Tax=Chitinophaga nivalis TaxID=2991709 RepID=A0ABT3IK47_9BACT|nr:DUF4377 domain-containing protein [Chitinophaga nivalis]MCW3465985.1 DUF4377 domain-containing protein [Chitinophaga nivalis]MCW3484324.1 DUF4377 domain-containing protein [Chitinophaga nivalis]
MSVKFFCATGLSLLTLAACNNGASTSEQSNNTDTTAATSSTTEIYYEAALPAASSPGRTIGLSLKPTGDAELVTDYQDYNPEIVEIGPWEKLDSGLIRLSLVTVGSGNSKKDTLVFKEEGEVLTYQGSNYGSEGLKLSKKDKPAAKEKELVMWVNKKKTTCTVPPGGPRECLEVAYGKVAPTKASEWQAFSEDIKGFDYKPGKVYQIKVKRTPRAEQLQDASAYTYELAEIIAPK